MEEQDINSSLSVREIQESDIPGIASYWLDSASDFLVGMGVDLQKLPSREQFSKMLKDQINSPYREKETYALIWLISGEAIGHCNVNKIIFGSEAYMHLHLWESKHRRKGMGSKLVRLSLPNFFNNLELEVLYCEPHARNPAPNITLERLGFTFVKEYTTIPGSINYEQPVKRWALDRKKWQTTLANT